jgi:hypothetical protein
MTMSNVTTKRLIAGAIYDFAAGLTCRDKPITFGKSHDAAPAAEACNEFLRKRDCLEGEPMVKDWQQHLGTARAFGDLRAAIQADPGYAWSWHCNVACSAMDEGLDHPAANRAAARFMFVCFGVDTSTAPGSSA